MKKLSILLIGLLLVSGLAFADFGTVAVTGSASVTFGVDLDTNYTGFANDASSTLKITLVDKASGTTGGDDGLYGEITLKDWQASASATDTITVTPGTVSAKIVVDPVSIKIYSAPSFSLDMAPTIDSGTVEGDIKTGITATGTNAIGGVTISIPAGPATIDIKAASDGDWLTNANNDYAVGADVSVEAGPATIDVGFLYGWLGAAAIGVSLGAEVDVAPATITLGFDGDASVSGAFAFDIAAGAVVALSDANADDDATEVSLDAYVYTGGAELDLDVALGFTEPEAGGLADMLYADLTIELLDVVAALAWNVDVSGGYDTGDVDPYFGFGYGSDSIFDLNVGVVLKSGLTGIDNTAVTLDYVSTDLSNDNGVITVEAKITY